MSSKLRLCVGGTLGLLLLIVSARCADDGPVTTGVQGSGGLTPAGKPKATDPNPPGWEGGGVGILSHDGFPTDIDFEGVGLGGCFGPVSEEYAGVGVHFSGGAQSLQTTGCLNSFNYPPHSPITVIFEPGDGTFIVDFDAPQSDVGVRYNTLFALTMTCYTGAGGTGGVVGADVATFPNLDNFGGSIAPPNETLNVVGAGILSCVIAGTPNFYTLDDLFADNLVAGDACAGQVTSPGVTKLTSVLVSTFLGTKGDDVIVGTSGVDAAFGRGGNDLICLLGGNDTADGGSGDDEIHGGDGNDTLFGYRGRDDLHGDAGNDLLFCGDDNDTADGGPGKDQFFLCETKTN